MQTKLLPITDTAAIWQAVAEQEGFERLRSLCPPDDGRDEPHPYPCTRCQNRGWTVNQDRDVLEEAAASKGWDVSIEVSKNYAAVCIVQGPSIIAHYQANSTAKVATLVAVGRALGLVGQDE